jgi:uncharacterized tellurite resistance protein B-like protein
MLNAIRDFLDRQLGATAGATADRHTIEVATAALLVEVARLDDGVDAAERAVVQRAVRDKFGLSPDDAQKLIAMAEDEARNANDYWQFTSIINKRFTQPQKVRVIEMLWEVAYADSGLNVYEEHLIRKLADLLHISHGDYITAKLRARDARGKP